MQLSQSHRFVDYIPQFLKLSFGEFWLLEELFPIRFLTGAYKYTFTYLSDHLYGLTYWISSYLSKSYFVFFHSHKTLFCWIYHLIFILLELLGHAYNVQIVMSEFICCFWYSYKTKLKVTYCVLRVFLMTCMSSHVRICILSVCTTGKLLL